MKYKNFLKEIFIFGLLQIKSCVFAGSFFVLLFISNFYSFGLQRYDFLFIGALLIQIILVAAKIENKNELKVITIFHIIGLILEFFKTHPAINSWSYPEDSFFKIATVPLYSGFMYAAVASYIIQSWKNMKLSLINYPPYYFSISVSVLAYLNFFTHHILPDIRWFLIILIFIIFRNTFVCFTIITKKERKMQLSISFILIAFFIWIAENISTFLKAWKYGHQANGWQMVDLHKISAWFLLVILSFIICSVLTCNDIDFSKKK